MFERAKVLIEEFLYVFPHVTLNALLHAEKREEFIYTKQWSFTKELQFRFFRVKAQQLPTGHKSMLIDFFTIDVCPWEFFRAL